MAVCSSYRCTWILGSAAWPRRVPWFQLTSSDPADGAPVTKSVIGGLRQVDSGQRRGRMEIPDEPLPRLRPVLVIFGTGDVRGDELSPLLLQRMSFVGRQ